ncbi:bindin-like [Diadema antillarum]|uniref:bindin-like n=1 Tax=Diadema antillarum TaxID=105358 RepID=UPI003A8935BE
MTLSPSPVTALFFIVFAAPVVLSAFPTRTSNDSDCGEAAKTCWCQNAFAQCWAPYEESSMDILGDRIQQLFQGQNDVECSCKSLRPFLKYSNVTLVNAASLLFTGCRAHGWEDDSMSALSLTNLCYQHRLSMNLVERAADDEMEKTNQMKGALPIVESGKKKSPPLFDFFMGHRKRRSVGNRQTDEAGYEQTGRQRRYNPTGNVGRAGAQQGGGTRAAYPPAQSGRPNYYDPRANNPQPAYAGREYGAPGARQQQYMENPSLPSGRANGAAPGPRQGAPSGHIPGPAYGPSYGPAPAGPVIPPAEGAGGDFDSVSRTMESDQPLHEYSLSSSQDDTISAEVLEKIKAVLGATKIDLPVDINDPYDLGLLLRHLRHHSNLLANIGDPDVRGQVLTAMQEDEYEEERDAATGAREELMALNAGGGEGAVERRHIRANQDYSEQEEEESDINQDSQEEPSDYPDNGEGVQASQYQNNMRSDFDQESQQVNRFRSPNENDRNVGFPFDDDYEAVFDDGGMEEEQHRSGFENDFAQDRDNDEQEDDYIDDDSDYDDEDEPEYQQEARRYGQRPQYNGPAYNGQEDNYHRQETRNNPYGQRQARAGRQGGSRGGVSQRRGR